MWPAGKFLQSGKYQIIRCIGRGGFGLTYLALDCLLKRQIVIKTPSRPLHLGQESERYIRRFQREGQVLSKFSHPNIVTILDFFQEESFPCLVMAYIEGETLEQYIRKYGPLSEELAVTIFRKVSSALHLLHQEEIVHCDIHPGNIMIQSDDEPILIDFGSTKMMQPSTFTVTTTINEHFSPYEQRKEGSKPQVHLDIYGLSATLYFSLTATKPTPAINRKLYGDEFKIPNQHTAQLSSQLSNLILRGMALEPQDRIPSMQKWIQHLSHDDSTTTFLSGAVQASPRKKTEGKRRYFLIGIITIFSIWGVLETLPFLKSRLEPENISIESEPEGVSSDQNVNQDVTIFDYLEVRVVADTLFKSEPILSSQLSSSQKVFVKNGTTFTLSSYEPAADNHFKITLSEMTLGPDQVVWYVYRPDVELRGDPGN